MKKDVLKKWVTLKVTSLSITNKINLQIKSYAYKGEYISKH